MDECTAAVSDLQLLVATLTMEVKHLEGKVKDLEYENHQLRVQALALPIATPTSYPAYPRAILPSNHAGRIQMR